MQMRRVLAVLALLACAGISSTLAQESLIESQEAVTDTETDSPSVSRLQNELAQQNAASSRLGVLKRKLQEELTNTRSNLKEEHHRAQVYLTNLRKAHAASNKLTQETQHLVKVNKKMMMRLQQVGEIAANVQNVQLINHKLVRRNRRLRRKVRHLKKRTHKLRRAVGYMHKLHAKTFRSSRVAFARSYRVMRRQYREALLRMRAAFRRSIRVRNHVYAHGHHGKHHHHHHHGLNAAANSTSAATGAPTGK